MAITTSVMTGGTNNHQTTSEEINGLATDFVEEGIVGDLTNTSGVAPATGGFAVNAQSSPDTTVAISAGVAYVTGTPSSQNSQTFRVKNSASTNLTISANSSGSTKYDWIYIKLDATLLNTPTTAGDTTATIVASRSSSASTDDGTPPTYGYPIAVVTVANGFSTITNGNIRDIREQAVFSTDTTASLTGWNSLGYTPDTVTYNGNRSYDMVYNSTDLTSILSAGMRLRTTRTVAAPTRCTDLESGSSQYYSKTSPNKLTFTDDFVCGAWVKLESYTGSTMNIIGRYNGTSGWRMGLTSSGQIFMQGFNAGVSNTSSVSSYQSIPLGKWVHVTAQLDMSAFTATTTTSYIMIDGVDVPASVARGGTNPTALVQAGDLNIGAANATEFFDGKIAQAFVASAKITQANVRTLISQGLTASLISTHSIASAYSFDNSIADLNTTTPNDLTANGSAVATNADSPFGTQASGSISSTLDYAIITSATFSTNTTLTVQVPEGCAIPTSGGVTSVVYSTQKSPYGFPAETGRWDIQTIILNNTTSASLSLDTFAIVTGVRLTAPIGAWDIVAELDLVGSSGASTMEFYIGVNYSTYHATNPDPTMVAHLLSQPSTTAIAGQVTRSKRFALTTATNFNISGKYVQGTGTVTYSVMGTTSRGSSTLTARLALL